MVPTIAPLPLNGDPRCLLQPHHPLKNLTGGVSYSPPPPQPPRE